MSSFWQIAAAKIKQQPQQQPLNQTLPFISANTNTIKKKGTSKTLHENLPSVHSKIGILNKQSIKSSNRRAKKQTQISIHCRSMYRLPTNKNKIQDTPILQFSNAILKIEDLFNQQCNVICQDEDIRSKFKKTLNNKHTFSKLNQIQSLLQTNPKKQAKKQFQQVLRIYNKTQLKITQALKLAVSHGIKQQQQNSSLKKSNNGYQRTKVKNNSMSAYFTPKQTKYLFKETRKSPQKQPNSSPLKQSTLSISKQHQQSLSILEKQQLFKQSKAFQKAQKHLILKTFTTKIFYHHLTAELAIEQGLLQQSLVSLYFCQYYARKIDFQYYIIPCLIIQAQIKQALYEYNSAINILKTALQFSVIKKWKQLELRILQKISIIYYYRGNSYMAKHYKELSQSGLNQYEAEIYIKQYSKNQQLKSLQARLFSLPFDGLKKKKHNQRYELDISRDLLRQHDQLILGHHQQVSQMLRSNKTSKIGIKLRKMILDNSDKGSVKKFNHQKKSTETIQRFVAFQYPLQHCSQIIKSHLSKDRYSLGSQIKSLNFIKTFNYMKRLYSQLCHDIQNQEYTSIQQEKQNFPHINAWKNNINNS